MQTVKKSHFNTAHTAVFTTTTRKKWSLNAFKVKKDMRNNITYIRYVEQNYQVIEYLRNTNEESLLIPKSKAVITVKVE